MSEKQETLDWLLKPRGKGYPFVTYRGGAMKTILYLEIPFDELAEFFEVESIDVRGRVYTKVK